MSPLEARRPSYQGAVPCPCGKRAPSPYLSSCKCSSRCLEAAGQWGSIAVEMKGLGSDGGEGGQ
ncbi:hypothetical protein E2562_004023 [Oryza meyeriana var. granulata]|uniref:Uncharacterized protein n=1 Tax=Oryza meyeriana var. granulata TaxID=110450 RepID=A0A6G1BIP7_9ORYZ|nr:hypothetical protein E2562_004023 [Oryza meyeriana var. granulata]